MDLGLTSEQKIASLTSIKAGIQMEIYNLLLRMGIDPDTYNPEEEIVNSDSFIGEKARVQTMVGSLALVESKLAELA